MLQWLKDILGDVHTEEIDKKVSEEIGKGFVAREDFNTVNEAKKQLDTQIKERDKQLSELQKSTGDNAEFQSTIKTLQEANKQMQDDHATQLKQLQKDNAVEKTLLGANARNLTASKALLADFLKDAEVSESGEVKGLSDAVKKLTEADDTKFLFDTDSAKKPQFKGVTPGEGGDAAPDPQRSGFESRLAEARKINDTLAAIKIKQEAAEKGVVLI